MAWLNVFLVSSFCALFIATDGRVIRSAKGRVDVSGEKTVKNALFIHSGVMRNYQKMWPIWENNFINPSKKAGVQFTVAVTTDLRLHCDPDAEGAFSQGNYNLPTKNACACMRLGDDKCAPFLKSITDESKAMFKRELQQIYGNASKDGTIDIDDATTEDLPTKHFNSVYTRARPILKRYENKTFDYIIVARPDVVLADSRNFSFKDREFDLVSLCNSHPGLNLISGAFTRKNDEVHHRDWDWGYVLCDGAHVERARQVLFGDCGPCRDSLKSAKKRGAECVPPERSAEFVSSNPKAKWSCDSRACSWFEGMQGMMRLGTLDDTLFGLWPRGLSHRDAGQDPYKAPL